MKINGYKLREAIRTWELRRKMASDNFEKSLHTFKDEDKTSPQELHKQFVEADTAIAKIQTLQARYNLAINVDVLGINMSLCQAVKMVGGAGRAEKLWRMAAVDKKDRYSIRPELTRQKDEEHAKRTISHKEAGKLAAASGKFAGALRAAIASANSQEIEIDKDLDRSLFE